MLALRASLTCSTASWDQQDFSDLEGIPELAGQATTRAGSLDLSSAGLAQAAAFGSSPQGRPTPLLASWRVARPARPFALSAISGSSGMHDAACWKVIKGWPIMHSSAIAVIMTTVHSKSALCTAWIGRASRL